MISTFSIYHLILKYPGLFLRKLSSYMWTSTDWCTFCWYRIFPRVSTDRKALVNSIKQNFSLCLVGMKLGIQKMMHIDRPFAKIKISSFSFMFSAPSMDIGDPGSSQFLSFLLFNKDYIFIIFSNCCSTNVKQESYAA